MVGTARPERRLDVFHRRGTPLIPRAATLRPRRRNFRNPPRVCTAGIALLAWRNGHQSHFIMPAGFQSGRSIGHDAEACRLAPAVRLRVRADLAEARIATVLSLHGIDQ